jgi:hypothetical protein
MTFDEALNLKKQYGDTYEIDKNAIGKVLVVPSEQNDLLNYSDDYRVSQFDDESAKKYSSDSQFIVCAMWTDGANILKKELR